MTLFGFVSTTFNRNLAESFAFSKESDKKFSTLIIIEWAGEQDDDPDDEISLTSEPQIT